MFYAIFLGLFFNTKTDRYFRYYIPTILNLFVVSVGLFVSIGENQCERRTREGRAVKLQCEIR